MRVFVTGATGFVGSAIVQELINAGHQVVGLARSEQSAQNLLTAGAEVHLGNLEDLESLKSAASDSDAVIHAGFIHDFSRFPEACETDRKVIETMGSVLAGTNRPFIITSALGIIRRDRPVTEDDMPAPGPIPRIATEQAADAVAATGVRVSVVRLPPSVHGNGDHGFIPMLINIAREKNMAVYAGAGQNTWPAVHRLDAAKLYLLALDKNAAPGTRYHAAAEEGIPFREITELIGRRLNVRVVSKSPEEAARHFTWFAHFAAMDIMASTKKTKAMLAWQPHEPGLLADLDHQQYFSN